jgi:hypothetical protein
MQQVAARNLAEVDAMVEDAFRAVGISDKTQAEQIERPEPSPLPSLLSPSITPTSILPLYP